MEIVEIGKSKQTYESFPAHRHGYWEVLLNVQGSGVLTADGVSYPFSPGTIAVIPPYVTHGKESPDGFRDRSVFLKTFRNIGRGGVKCFQDDADHTVEKIIDMAERFWRPQEAGRADGTSSTGGVRGAGGTSSADGTDGTHEVSGMDEMNGAILNVLGDLLYQVLAFYYNQSRKKDIRLEGVIELMHENIANPRFDLAEAIAASGYSLGYFRKIFKEMTGLPPVTYFNHLRIAHAKSLFAQYGTSRTVREIAYSCGFEDALYFSRVFRQNEGMSPQQYIESLRRGRTEEDEQMLMMDTPEEYIGRKVVLK